MSSRHADLDRVFADSSGFHALANPRDRQHLVAQRLFRRLNQRSSHLYTTRYVLAETHALILARTRNRVLALESLLEIESSRGTTLVPVLDEDEQRARAILRQYDDKLFSLTDAVSFAVMQRLRLRVAFTFDDDFAQAGFTDLRQLLA